ncbi:T9SS type A sorting domain-containing protein [Candidatus Neomarinimicrobiota bacterium]
MMMHFKSWYNISGIVRLILVIAFVMPGPYLLGTETWTRAFGGSELDEGYSVQQTSDGGYIIAGRTTSFGAGYYDVYLIRTDSTGDTLWTKTFGGSEFDSGYFVQQTSDNGYIITGSTKSYGHGNADVYLIKSNETGDTVWTRTFGGSGFDAGYSVQQTSDDGYIIIGKYGSHGPVGYNIYLIKTNSQGDTLWTRALEGHIGYSGQQTSDGGYIITGEDDGDVCLLKTDSSGNSLWTKTYGESEYDFGRSVRQITGGGYIITGRYAPPDGYESESYVYLINTNSSGDTLWTRRIGQVDGISEGSSVQQTNSGDYIIIGTTRPYDIGPRGLYLIKTSTSGDTLWTRTFGGTSGREGNSVQQTIDGGYIIAGTITQDIGTDIYILKTDDAGIIMGLIEGQKKAQEIPEFFTLFQNYPNPFNPVSTIQYDLPQASEVSLIVYDLLGREVIRLVDGTKEPGYHEVQWNGRGFATGVYLARLVTPEYSKAIKMVLLK